MLVKTSVRAASYSRRQTRHRAAVGIAALTSGVFGNTRLHTLRVISDVLLLWVQKEVRGQSPCRHAAGAARHRKSEERNRNTDVIPRKIPARPAVTKNAPERNLKTSFQLILITKAPGSPWGTQMIIQAARKSVPFNRRLLLAIHRQARCQPN
jgi:hypothetical protein